MGGQREFGTQFLRAVAVVWVVVSWLIMPDVCGGRDAYFLMARKWGWSGGAWLCIPFMGALLMTASFNETLSPKAFTLQ